MYESMPEPPPKPRYCGVKVAVNNSRIIMGRDGNYKKDPQSMICPEDCPGLQEVPRANLSILRLVYGEAKLICGNDKS